MQTNAKGRAAIVPLLAGVTFLVFGTNLQGVLVPILGHERGSSMIAIGLFSAAWSTGFVVACVSVGWLLNLYGHVRAFTLLAMISASCGLLLALAPDDVAWILLRLVIGFCYGGLAAIVEGWLIQQAGSGFAFASYMIANLLASLGGTLSLDVIDPTRWTALALGAVTVAASSLPIVLGRLPQPPREPAFRPMLGTLFRASPVGATGCVLTGLITGGIGGLGPVFGMMSGLDMQGDTLMLAANSIGGALAYLPVTLLASRLDRRLLLALVAGVGIVLCLAIVLGAPRLGTPQIIVVLGAFGFVQYPLYGLCVGIANADQPDRPSPQIATEVLLLFGLGTIAGPMIAGQVMRAGPQHLFSFVGLALLLIVGIVALDRSRRPTATPGLAPG
ncbi:MFS transporter [Lichenicoccus roseus]|uniref:MFS transporter n=1 Tax=Lichenicoccus roseus TaxID=2683649 RepID=A0A5R9J745_9PROT|nr:MFS transporter [Lichenicoccus roseus]TLU73392.1 MFS transporter [Lichenicoccus roseus]